MSRYRIRRTPNSGPPEGLLFGELAYSDGDQQLYVGRPSPAPPATFGGNPTDYGPAIATLTTSDAAQAAALATLQAQTVTYGFTYDQQDEPSSPAVGSTWRERSSGGLIVAEWEWSGSLWLSIRTFSRPFTVLASGNTFTAVAVTAELLDPAGAYLYMGFRGTAWANALTNSSNYWQLRAQANRRSPSSDSVTDGNAYVTLANATPATVNVEGQSVVNLQASEVFQYPSGLVGFRLWAQMVGAPGSLRLILSILYRRVRG
ncbi:hypothetical protein PGN35_025305 [Nodosilinea sp. PGN35]|uniref:hypothetical protein n=1 Tax=Nodosilinea sp. PGN35 TaxID=3020489 RepID=UPI0023B2A71D|nr:hypothetical protein [Nodosilinea sp. TSF1-S3]MDF0367447.1 hypothetical protein [Nodosilinea sp. TSF1-S3]